TRVLKDIEGLKMIWLQKTDVVRHALVQKIISAYENVEILESDS
ncbi:MAG: PhoH family protein, partial [Candidatus Omnitrophica bacterium]|nr:PhoH family protein [Candidatus Omnitrophota bacterium]